MSQNAAGVTPDRRNEIASDQPPKGQVIHLKVGGVFASAMVILGSFLPWATIADGGGIVYGMERTGVLTLLVGIAMAVLFGFARRRAFLAAAVVSLVAAVAGVLALVDLWPELVALGSRMGLGVFMILGGGVSGIFAGVLGVLADRIAARWAPRPPHQPYGRLPG